GSLSIHAKSRCELRRSDQPDYDIAAIGLRAARNQIRDFHPGPGNGFAAGLSSQQERIIMGIVKDYNKLVYDIAHVRTPRRKSANALIERMDALLQQDRGHEAAI